VVLARFRPSIKDMTAEKGKSMKKSAAVVAGVILALGVAAPAFADADATGVAVGSPGFLSGNVFQVPIHAPLNDCGNSIGATGLLNPAFGNVCVNR
jgi:hypothetical protein